jgi:hypothetical protein
VKPDGEFTMKSFFGARGLSLAAVVLIMLVVSLAQGGISYTIAFGPLRGFPPRDPSSLATVLLGLRVGLAAILVLLWTLELKRALFRVLVIANGLCTLALLVHTTALTVVLFGSALEALHTLILDVTLMSVSNILIFSIWYWIIDPPGVEEIPRADEPWDFLFLQRGNSLPYYDSWGSILSGLSVPCVHDQFCVHPDGHAAANATRQDADAAARGYLGHHADRNCR